MSLTDVRANTRKTITGATTDFVHDGINPVTESSPGGTGFLLTEVLFQGISGCVF